MATIADGDIARLPLSDALSGTVRARSIDRWIFVFMAAWFIAIVLTGFIPDSLDKIAAVNAGHRPPFPVAMHVHAVLMGSFLLLLLAQTILVATGRTAFHRQLGILGMVLAAALVVAGFVLAPTTYHIIWDAAQSGPAPAREAMQRLLATLENILLLQIRVGILFALFITIGLWMRNRDSGLHKRMMILSIAVALPAAFDRMEWLPTTMPANTYGMDLWVVAAIAPMLLWDIFRNRTVHRAYWIWFPIYAIAAVVVNQLWNTPAWHATARHIMGV